MRSLPYCGQSTGRFITCSSSWSARAKLCNLIWLRDFEMCGEILPLQEPLQRDDKTCIIGTLPRESGLRRRRRGSTQPHHDAQGENSPDHGICWRVLYMRCDVRNCTWSGKAQHCILHRSCYILYAARSAGAVTGLGVPSCYSVVSPIV
jgi:hypothetical protein